MILSMDWILSSLTVIADTSGLPEAYWPAAVGTVLALLFLVLSLRAGRKRRLIDNIPTAKTSGVFIGLVELSGTAESSSPLLSYLAEIPCVSFRWSVEEHWSRMVTEHYTDAKGRRRTRRRRKSGWRTVADGGQYQPFYLKDDCGVILVRPQGAKVEDHCVFEETCSTCDPLYYQKGPAWAVSHSDHRRRFSEHAIPLHSNLYIIGRARERQDVVAPEIAADESAPMFLISMRSEQQISSGLGWQFWLWGLVGAMVLAIGWFVSTRMVGRHPPEADVGLWVVSALCFAGCWALGWVWMVFNSLVHLRQMVTQAWANVDVQLRRRADMIPNLVEAVKGFGDHERTVHESLALLRSQAQATRPGQPGPDPVATRRAIMAIVERYPQLKADGAFVRLQQQLADTENRIALAREYYNNIASHYNRRLEIVPDSAVAWMGGLRSQPLFAAAGFERLPVAVELAK